MGKVIQFNNGSNLDENLNGMEFLWKFDATIFDFLRSMNSSYSGSLSEKANRLIESALVVNNAATELAIRRFQEYGIDKQGLNSFFPISDNDMAQLNSNNYWLNGDYELANYANEYGCINKAIKSFLSQLIECDIPLNITEELKKDVAEVTFLCELLYQLGQRTMDGYYSEGEEK